eukprot:scaffold83676_cov34-Phaeocystis_antarctica.AAC.4
MVRDHVRRSEHGLLPATERSHLPLQQRVHVHALLAALGLGAVVRRSVQDESRHRAVGLKHLGESLAHVEHAAGRDDLVAPDRVDHLALGAELEALEDRLVAQQQQLLLRQPGDQPRDNLGRDVQATRELVPERVGVVPHALVCRPLRLLGLR